jgi:hypothetical protein
VRGWDQRGGQVEGSERRRSRCRQSMNRSILGEEGAVRSRGGRSLSSCWCESESGHEAIQKERVGGIGVVDTDG